MMIIDYAFNILLYVEWQEDNNAAEPAILTYFTPAEVGDEMAYQGLCASSYVDRDGNAVCDMTSFQGYQPGEWATPAHVWSTLGPDQKLALVRGLIAQHKSEVK